MRGTLKKTLFFSVCFVLALSATFAKAQETIEEESAILPIAEDIETAAGEMLITPAPEEISEPVIEPVIEEEVVDENAIQTLVNQDTDITAEDLGVSDPAILPGNPFYFAKTWWRNIRSATTFNPVKKAELRLQHANEKIVEAKILAEESGDTARLETAIQNYKEELDNIQERVDIIKETNAGEDNKERLENFLDKFTDNQIKQQKIIDVITEKAPEKMIAKITEIKNNSISQLANIPLQFENAEQFRERLENKLESQAGSAFKNFKNLEVLKEVEAKVPEQAKEAIQRAQENTLRRLENTMDILQDQEQNQFKYYVEKIGGNEVRHIEILHDFELREMPEEMRTEIEQAKEKAFQSVQTTMNKFQSEEIKGEFINHLQNGTIENIRIIKELENNLPPNTFGNFIEVKTKSMDNFRQNIENSDNPDVQVDLMTQMTVYHDVKQMEMFKEMDQYIPADKQVFWGEMQAKAQNEMQQDFQNATTAEAKTRTIQMLAGDSPEHIKVLQEFSLPPEMMTAMMQEQVNKIDVKMNGIEDPRRLQFMRENIEGEEFIQNNIQQYNPQIMQKMDMKENILMQNMSKEEAEKQIRKALELNQKLNTEISGTNQDVKNIIAGQNNFQSNNITMQDKLNFAQQALEKGDYQAAFEMSNTVINRANENRQIMQNTKLNKDFENRDNMLIQQRTEQKKEDLNQLQQQLNNVSGSEERQIREQIQSQQQIIQKLEAPSAGNIGDKLQIIREEQRKEQSNTGGAGACTMDWNPVCGKDGNTYSNLCVANNKGAQIDYFGECKKIEMKSEPFEKPSLNTQPMSQEPQRTPAPMIEKPANFTEILMPFISWAF